MASLPCFTYRLRLARFARTCNQNMQHKKQCLSDLQQTHKHGFLDFVKQKRQTRSRQSLGNPNTTQPQHQLEIHHKTTTRLRAKSGQRLGNLNTTPPNCCRDNKKQNILIDCGWPDDLENVCCLILVGYLVALVHKLFSVPILLSWIRGSLGVALGWH